MTTQPTTTSTNNQGSATSTTSSSPTSTPTSLKPGAKTLQSSNSQNDRGQQQQQQQRTIQLTQNAFSQIDLNKSNKDQTLAQRITLLNNKAMAEYRVQAYQQCEDTCTACLSLQSPSSNEKTPSSKSGNTASTAKSLYYRVLARLRLGKYSDANDDIRTFILYNAVTNNPACAKLVETAVNTLSAAAIAAFTRGDFSRAADLYEETRHIPFLKSEDHDEFLALQCTCLLQIPGNEKLVLRIATEQVQHKNCSDVARACLIASLRLGPEYEDVAMNAFVAMCEDWQQPGGGLWPCDDPAIALRDAHAFIPAYISKCTKDHHLNSQEEGARMKWWLEQYLDTCKSNANPNNIGDLLSVVHQSIREIAWIRNRGLFNLSAQESLPQVLNKFRQLMRESVNNPPNRAPKGLELNLPISATVREWKPPSVSVFRRVVLSHNPPSTRAELQKALDIKWPNPEDYISMRPHACAHLPTYDDVVKWYPLYMLNSISRELYEKNPPGSLRMPDKLSVYPQFRIHPGQTPLWWVAYRESMVNQARAFVWFREMCEKFGVCDVYTYEYVDALVKYLKLRAIQEKWPKGSVIVEVGDDKRGLLTACLRHVGLESHFRLQACDIHALPTSSATGNNDDDCAVFPVQRGDAIAFVKSKSPTVVICPWMPKGVDWTAAFRAVPSVKEYILIAHEDTGVSGDPWKTWGFAGDVERYKGQRAPYQKDGWEKLDHPEIAKFGISRFDTSGDFFFSSVVSFIKDNT